MEVLQIVVGPLAPRLIGEDFVVDTALAAPMDVGEVREEQPRAADRSQPRSVMVRGKRVDAGLHVGEVLQKQRGHVRVDAIAVRHRRAGTGAPRRFATLAPRGGFRKSTQGETMSDIPGDPRQLGGAVGDAREKAGQRSSHWSRHA